MKIARIKFIVRDDFEPGDCIGCPLYYDDATSEEGNCSLGYRNCDCPIELDYNSYAMDEEDITD